MPTLVDLLQGNARQAVPNGPAYQQPNSLMALLVNALRSPQNGMMYGNPQARHMMNVPAQPFGNQGIHAWPNPGESMPNAYRGDWQEADAVHQGDHPNIAGAGNLMPVADTWAANRGTDSRVAQPGYVGQSVAAQDTGNQAKAAALNELKAMGPPQMWAPAQVAANMARMQQLQAVVRGALR